ncbi:hypothetical protein L1987_33336 [Smallanthus sonchifolius]|uniref:Uncharacterized protein n=1 Tax=Smallanthus sonchifolius TaxID=185202 RepID=A0ACB9HQ26_9ASTR|nr:hypothetical protein L1987_33336 [Smallanthus sonchifolius]
MRCPTTLHTRQYLLHRTRRINPLRFLCFCSQPENGCSGVFVLLVSTKNPKVTTYKTFMPHKFSILQVERGNKDGNPGYLVTLFTANREELEAIATNLERYGGSDCNNPEEDASNLL